MKSRGSFSFLVAQALACVPKAQDHRLKPVPRQQNRRTALPDGFTLLEMMLAITILSFILIVIASSFNAVAHSKTHGEDRLNLDREGRATMWEMSNELRGALQTPMAISRVVFVGTGQMRDGMPEDSLTLSTVDGGHRRSITSFGAEQIVAYNLAPNPDHRRWFILTRSQISGLLTSGAGDAAPIVLADNVISLHLRYFNGNAWLESWDSSALPRNQQLPLAVSVDLQLGAANGRVFPFSTQITVPMALTIW
jgi:type II secretion system protein J